MRFDRYPRIAFEWTARKAAAALRRQKAERDALPLFAAQVAAAQPALEVVQAQREREARESDVQRRRLVAAEWRRGRRALRALPPAERTAVLAGWQASGCPGSGEYLAERVWQVYRRLGLVGPGHAQAMAEWDAAVERLERQRHEDEWACSAHREVAHGA
jgi:hypothetical protein